MAFFIEGAPVPKGRPRVTRSGRTYTPARTVAWEALVAAEAMVAMRKKHLYSPMTGPLQVDLMFYGARANSDLDNLCKAILDAGNGVLWHDDKQINKLTIGRDGDPGIRKGVAVSVGIQTAFVGTETRESER